MEGKKKDDRDYNDKDELSLRTPATVDSALSSVSGSSWNIARKKKHKELHKQNINTNMIFLTFFSPYPAPEQQEERHHLNPVQQQLLSSTTPEEGRKERKILSSLHPPRGTTTSLCP